MLCHEAMKQAKDLVHLQYAQTTAKTYCASLNRFALYLTREYDIQTTHPLERLDIEPFIAYPAWLSRQSYSKGTMRVHISAAKFFLDWLVINGYIKLSYAETLRFNKAVEQTGKRRESKLPRTPRSGDVEKMLETVYTINEEAPRKERNIALLEFLASSGCRNNEAVTLKVRDIDLIEHSAVVTGKGDKQRKVYFGTDAARALREYWTARGNADPASPVFSRHDRGAGKKIKPITTETVRDIVEGVMAVAGIDPGTFSPHRFRHGFAITMLQETSDLALVQDLLGHSSPVSTRVYAKIYPETMRKAHKKVFG